MQPRDVVASLDRPAGAYVHIPFCAWICPFCPYNKVLADVDLARRYFEGLRREIDGYVEAYRATHAPAFTSLYVGGGTPTLYPDELSEVVARIPVSNERAIEVLPTHATPAALDRLAGMGFTAVSVGAQSFHDEVLARLHRPHGAAAARAGVERALGRFRCVDVDLIVDVEWGADAAFLGAFLDDVRVCFGLGVDQVSTYPLMRFGFTPFGTARHDRGREHAVLARATALAEAMGYERRSVWTFNRRGSPAYTSITRRRFIGMGAGGSSFTGRDFFVNHFGLAPYLEDLAHDRLPLARWLHLGRWGGAAYETFWQAYAGGIDLRALDGAYGASTAEVARAFLVPLAAAGLARRVPGGYRLTPRGFDAYHDLERLVTYGLIEPLWGEMLAEHRAAAASGGRASWAVPMRGRAGTAWRLVRCVTERPVPNGTRG